MSKSMKVSNTDLQSVSRTYSSHDSNFIEQDVLRLLVGDTMRIRSRLGALEPVMLRLELHRLQGLEIACICCSSPNVCMHVLGFETREESVVQVSKIEPPRHLRAHVRASYMQTWVVCFSPCTIGSSKLQLDVKLPKSTDFEIRGQA